MGVAWGRLIDAGAGRGTFREIWRLVWVPELSVRLAEALVHGVTIEQAAAGAAIAQAAAHGADPASWPSVVRRCLLSDLPEAAQRCIALLQAAAVNAVDIVGLLRAVPSLVSILRYGTARECRRRRSPPWPTRSPIEVIAGIGLACGNLDDDAAEEMRKAAAAFDAALVLLGDDRSDRGMGPPAAAAGRATPRSRRSSPALALRLLYDRASRDEESVTAAFFARPLAGDGTEGRRPVARRLPGARAPRSFCRTRRCSA